MNKLKYNTRKRVQTIFTQPSLTEQTHKQSCDINNIVNTFTKTGQIPSLNTTPQEFGNAPNIDLKSALDLVKNLHAEFNELSAENKAQFDGKPENYANFLQQYEESPESFYSEPIFEDDISLSKNNADTNKVSPPSSDET